MVRCILCMMASPFLSLSTNAEALNKHNEFEQESVSTSILQQKAENKAASCDFPSTAAKGDPLSGDIGDDSSDDIKFVCNAPVDKEGNDRSTEFDKTVGIGEDLGSITDIKPATTIEGTDKNDKLNITDEEIIKTCDNTASKDGTMYKTKNWTINEKGHLEFCGCDLTELVKIYGTPLYVMDENSIRQSCRMYNKLMHEFYADNYKVIYASKAFNCKEICRIMADEGLYIDVVSGGELYTALKAGFPASRIYFHGNNKTVEELKFAVDNKVGRIVIDNLAEAQRLSKILSNSNSTMDVLLRVTPGIDAHTHKFIKTGQVDSKFGVSIQSGEALEVISQIIELGNLNFKGIHCHIGSQIADPQPFVLAAETMMDFSGNIKRTLGIEVEEINLGGGFGIDYVDGEMPLDYKECIKRVSKVIRQRSSELGLKKVPCICIEPGRSIVAKAGITLYTVGGIKEIPGARTYVSVDGGMTDNPRYILYGSRYTVLNASNLNGNKVKGVTIAGKCCESGDIIQENVTIASPKVGDIIAVISTGAYNYSMASNYNRIPKPAVVMVNDSLHRLIVRRQTFEDVCAQDL